jgi:GWxTD domain-containing protein
MMKHSFIFILLLFSCSSQKKVGYAHLTIVEDFKSKQVDNLPIKYQVFREDKTNCKIYYQMDPNEFLSMRDSNGNWNFQLSLSLEVKTSQLFRSSLVDLIRDTAVSSKELILDSFLFVLPERKDVLLELVVFDKNKHTNQSFYSFWKRDLDFIAEDLSISNAGYHGLLKGDFIQCGQASIKKNTQLMDDFQLEVYQNIFVPAERMYAASKSLDIVHLKPKINITGTLFDISKAVNTLKVESYCQIFPNETFDEKKEKKFQFTMQSQIQNYSIEPLTYLLPDGNENNRTVSMNDWSKYWEQASNNQMLKAEGLINEFNRRVKFSNDNFSSYKLGWQTDRGMMYILLGKPDRVQNDVRGEIWVYGFAELTNKEFIFERNLNGLNENDYVLYRDLFYREFWQAAVYRWENGWINIQGY